MIPLPFFLKATMRPAGIVAIRALPQSKMRIALRYVPPTTLIGAIAYPLLHIAGDRSETVYEEKTFRSSAGGVLELFDWVTVKTLGKPRIQGALLKINTIYRGNVQSAVTSFPFAVTYGTNDILITAVYLINEEALGRSSYTRKDIERAAWGITRLGSRESVVSVEDVETGRAEVAEAEMAKTAYAFPFNGVEVKGKGTLQSVVDWRSGIGDYSKAGRMVMFYPEESVEVRGRLRTIKVGEEVVVLAQ
ncbi:type I-A CRISPR-associated protein Cas5a [Thermococcus zilligii]|uniref:type I-A CRISPR-associated protein Cas5a n=1 Tax=Thermococcus zilligii TaxID=54076 RepID=UPI001ED983A7|nr:type I-A CRISPR-associated protein Cas5a [Thermococcus zilligii]